MARRRKKTRTQAVAGIDESRSGAPNDNNSRDSGGAKIPKSLVIRRGKTNAEVSDLVDDMRQLMLPYTALNFQENPKNRKLTLSQYATNLALPMGITHMMAFSQKKERLHCRLARTPAGPTLTFRVHHFSLAKHVKRLQRRPVSTHTSSMQSHPPVVVTNNFGAEKAPPHVKLMRITFQNMFPAINVSTVKLADCRRVVLFNLLEEEAVEEVHNADSSETKQGEDEKESRPPPQQQRTRQVVEVRHYAIQATPVGVNRKVRRLLNAKLPNLNKVNDIADYLTGQATGAYATDAASDSEPEDDPNHVVQLPDKYAGKGNVVNNKSALKLVELGPRMSWELLKVEKGLGFGDVLYHSIEKKSAKEVAALKERHERAASAKVQRRAEQEANVERKRKAAEEKREAKRQRREERERATMQELKQGMSEENGTSDDEESSGQQQQDYSDDGGDEDGASESSGG